MLIEEAIARRVAGFTYDGIDAGLLHVLKRSIVDSYAAICGSLKDRMLLSWFDRLAEGSVPDLGLHVWGIGRQANHLDALFMNTILARRSDLLSTYLSPNGMGGSHPSDNVATALTLADWKGMSGKELLTTVFTAFYLSAAFATYYAPESANYDHDASATFYTALTIGHALGCSEEELVSAQRIAGMFGLDLDQAAVGQVTDWKHCTYASCALRGLQAVKLAAAGFEAPAEIYEGAAGVNQFFPHADAVFVPPPDLGRIIFKRWPALVFCQTPIDVARLVSARIADRAAIRSVRVKTCAVALRNGATAAAYHPTSRAGRTHSIPYCVATALLKPVEYEDFDEPRASDEKLTRLMAQIEVVEDPDITGAYPARSTCVVTATLADGSTVEERLDYPKGDPSDPLSDAEIEDKLRRYFFFATGDDERDEVVERLWALEEQQDLDWLIAPLRRAVPRDD